jgi:hypothetical protein
VGAASGALLHSNELTLAGHNLSTRCDQQSVAARGCPPQAPATAGDLAAVRLEHVVKSFPALRLHVSRVLVRDRHAVVSATVHRPAGIDGQAISQLHALIALARGWRQGAKHV